MGCLLYSLSDKVPLKNKNNHTIGILGVSVDITNAKQEITDKLEMLENILAMVPGTLYWMDKEGYYLGCNDNQAEVIGLNSRKEILGKRNIDMPGFLISEILDPINKEVMEQGKTILLEEPAILKDGTRAIFLSSKTSIIVGMKLWA